PAVAVPGLRRPHHARMGRGGGAPLTASATARARRRRAVRFAPEHAPALRAFNERLAHAGAPWRFPETTAPDWLPRVDGVRVRRRAGVRWALDLACVTGVGWLGLTLADLALRARALRAAPPRIDVVRRFDEWADAIWAANAPRCSFVGSRDAAALNATYPPES